MIKRLAKSCGFTLMELLIVVAILAILVAVMISTMTNTLNKTKESADIANIRAAYAEVRDSMLLNDSATITKNAVGKLTITTSQGTTAVDIHFPDKFSDPDSEGNYYYDAQANDLKYIVNFNLGIFSEIHS